MTIEQYMLKVIVWWMMSIGKFLLAPSTMVWFAEYNWSFLEIVLITSSGAALGLFIFYNLGDIIFTWLDNRTKKPKIFSWRTRFITKIKTKYGLKGLLLISGLISVPITGLIAARYFKSDTTLPLLIMGFCIWSIALTGLSVLLENVLKHFFV